VNTKDKGNIGILQAASRLVELGYSVSIPFGDNDRYDLVYEHSGDFVRAQVKFVSLKDGCITVPVRTTYMGTDGPKHAAYFERDVDEFLVYCPDVDELYRISFGELKEHTSNFRLRVEDAKACNDIPARRAADYILK